MAAMAANERTTDDHIRKGSRTWRWPDPSGGVYRTEFKNPLRLSYPFAVKSNASVVPGQFFALPLPEDRWAAGCVLGVGPIARARRSRLIVGLYDWISEEPPTELALVGAQVVRPAPDAEQMVTMVSAREFTAAGIEILGWGPASTNQAVLRRFVGEVISQGRYETLPDLIHLDYRYYGPDGGEIRGQEGLRHLIAEFRRGFSDLTAHVIDEIEQGERIALTMTLSGTHDGEFDGISPTGQRIELPIAVVTRFVDNLIIEDREYYDTTTLLAQLGVDLAEPTSAEGFDGLR